jgi:hypothetical protein
MFKLKHLNSFFTDKIPEGNNRLGVSVPSLTLFPRVAID